MVEEKVNGDYWGGRRFGDWGELVYQWVLFGKVWINEESVK